MIHLSMLLNHLLVSSAVLEMSWLMWEGNSHMVTKVKIKTVCPFQKRITSSSVQNRWRKEVHETQHGLCYKWLGLQREDPNSTATGSSMGIVHFSVCCRIFILQREINLWSLLWGNIFIAEKIIFSVHLNIIYDRL